MSNDAANDKTAGHTASRSRRGLLAAAAGALGAAAAESLGAATPAQASGPAVQMSADNTGATGRTAIFTTGNGEWAQLADSGTGSPSAHQGSTGVYGHGQDIGVLGDAGGNGTGVKGMGSGTGPGIHGEADPTGDGNGVEGIGHGNGHGVLAHGSGTGRGLYAFGIFGGVFGGGGNGPGVEGSGGIPNGTGVIGTGGQPGGHGVHGVGAGVGVGVLAENTAGGMALKAIGPASFTGTASFGGQTTFSRSGMSTVAKGKSSVTITGVALTSASLVLATLQQYAAGVYILAAVPKVSASSFTIHLSKVVLASTKVAWFVVN